VGGKQQQQQQHTSPARLVPIMLLCPMVAFIADVALVCSGMPQV